MDRETIQRIESLEVIITIEATGKQHLTVADVATFVDLCKRADVPLNTEVTIERDTSINHAARDIAIRTYHRKTKNLEPFPPGAMKKE